MTSSPLTGTLAEVGEFALVAALRDRFRPGDGVVVGPGDDAAVITVATGQQVATVDVLVQDSHFRLDWSSAYDVGRKAAASNLSDVNAMGGRTTGLLVGLAAPPTLDVGWALDLASGIADECADVGASVIGGDVTRGDGIVVSITAVGECHAGVVRRAGAGVGDRVAHAGRLGWAAAGYHVLSRGFRSPRAAVDYHRRPIPPYGMGEAAAVAGADAMIDVSDGLVQDLGHLARESGVSIDLHRDAFEVPEVVATVGAALGIDPLHLMLTGGEDYGLAATFPADRRLPEGFTQLGTVVEGEAGLVTVDGAVVEDPAGYQHFR